MTTGDEPRQDEDDDGQGQGCGRGMTWNCSAGPEYLTNSEAVLREACYRTDINTNG